TINIASLNGFVGSLSPITCTGAPVNATCAMSYQPNVLAPVATATLPLVITTQAPTKVSLAPPASLSGRPFGGADLGLGFACLALLAAAGLFASRRRARAGLAAFALAAALGIGLLSGCGGNPPSAPRYFGGTSPGTYTLTVSATAAGITHSTTIQLHVQ
ncbi:MAG: hypothetical protein ACRD17_03540, partial [Terriglobales bacterium]